MMTYLTRLGCLSSIIKQAESMKIMSRSYSLTRVVNTMSNSFFQRMDLLDRVCTNKGVDAQMSLRDKLKAYASEVESKVDI